ncbi:MAG: flagellar protein [Xanthobacteraceae bacterium]|nr:flagellar protein [Xanthobacteraceae bacterium]QYK44079.1 MAG: flagellar protein [Xanthobacteraceae bacterium]
MASNITLSAGVRANLMSLQSTAEMMNSVQQKLATGKKVNSAIDNPVNFFTAAGLQARAGDLSTLLDSVSNAVQTINAADKGISAITKLVEAAKSTAKQALTASLPASTSTLSVAGSAIAADDSVATGTVGSITGASTLQSLGIANGETITISDGTNTVTHTVVDASAEDIDDVITTLNGGAATWTVAVNGSGQLEATAGSNADTLTISGNGADSAFGTTTTSSLVNSDIGALTGTLTVQLGTGTAQTLTFGSGNIETRADLTTALSSLGITGLTANITTNAITFSSTNGEALTLGGTVLPALGLTAGSTNATTTIGTPNATRASLQADFNSLLTQISQLASDASFNGVNLLNGDNLSVVFNENGSSSLSINGVTFDAAGLGLTTQAGDAFQTNSTINAVITSLDTATSTLRTQSSTFGSKLSVVQTRQDFTKNLINVLQIGADNLTLADTNEEGANLLALQTRQSLSTTSLAMAAQADQNVLRLFG